MEDDEIQESVDYEQRARDYFEGNYPVKYLFSNPANVNPALVRIVLMLETIIRLMEEKKTKCQEN